MNSCQANYSMRSPESERSDRLIPKPLPLHPVRQPNQQRPCQGIESSLGLQSQPYHPILTLLYCTDWLRLNPPEMVCTFRDNLRWHPSLTRSSQTDSDGTSLCFLHQRLQSCGFSHTAWRGRGGQSTYPESQLRC